LKQSKRIDEIARKLDEFIQKNQLDKKSNAVENIADSKPAESLALYQGVEAA